MRAHQFGRVNLIECNLPVCFKKGAGLFAPGIIQAGIYTAALHNAAQVKVGLPVTYNVDFFSAQFWLIFDLIIARKNKEIVQLTKPTFTP